MRRNPAAKVASGALGDRDLSHLCELPRQKTPFEKPFETACLKTVNIDKSLISMVGAQGLEPWTR
jgi:hypothetical protein